MDDAEITRELTESQAELQAAEKARGRRQRAVVAAREAGWSKYQIAKVLDVGAPTVDSILRAASKEQR